PSMAGALGPLMLACRFILAQPGIRTPRLLSAVYFAFGSNISNVMTYDASGFLNAAVASLISKAIGVARFASFFAEDHGLAGRRVRRQLLVHLSDLGSACPSGAALRCYQRALFEQLGAALARVKGEPKVAHECLTSALTALSAAQAIGRVKTSLEG